MGKFIDKIIDYKDDDLYVVFYSSTCGYSIKLLNYLKNNKINFKGYDVNNGQDRFQNLLIDLNENKAELIYFDPSHRTKPIVFYKGKFIGGAGDTISLLSYIM